MNVPTEAQEQTALFQWAAMMEGRIPELKLLHAVPNGGSRHPVEARHLKEQGVKPGIPDIFLPCARGPFHGLYIEMKRRQGGRVSVEQKKMILALRVQGYRAEVCRGWEGAKDRICEYLREDTTNGHYHQRNRRPADRGGDPGEERLHGTAGEAETGEQQERD